LGMRTWVFAALVQSVVTFTFVHPLSRCAYICRTAVPRCRTVVPHLSASESFDEEQKLRIALETLKGLQADGYDAEMLAPLLSKIAELEKQVERRRELASLRPPTRSAQETTAPAEAPAPAVDAPAEAEDEAAAQFDSIPEAVSQFDSIPEAVSQFDSIPEAVSQFDSIPVVSPTGQAAAEMERVNEAKAMAMANDVDLTFARCFLTSEEARFGIAQKQIGVNMWSREQDIKRMQTIRAFLNKLLEGVEVETAMVEMAMRELVRAEYKKECRLKMADPSSWATADATVEGRFALAWQDRERFVATMKKDWMPDSIAPPKPSYNGLSAVGRLRAKEEYERQLRGEKKDETAEKMNAWFKDFMDRMS